MEYYNSKGDDTEQMSGRVRRLVKLVHYVSGGLSLNVAERRTHRVSERLRTRVRKEGWVRSVASTVPAGDWYWSVYAGVSASVVAVPVPLRVCWQWRTVCGSCI